MDENFAKIYYRDDGFSYYNSMSGGKNCNIENSNLVVTIYNNLGRTASIQWYGTTQVTPLYIGRNVINIPRHQQIERAKIMYETCLPKCRFQSCPWTMLQIGHIYDIKDECGQLKIYSVSR